MKSFDSLHCSVRVRVLAIDPAAKIGCSLLGRLCYAVLVRVTGDGNKSEMTLIDRKRYMRQRRARHTRQG